MSANYLHHINRLPGLEDEMPVWRRCEHLRAPISSPVLISSDANQTILIRRLLYLRAATTVHPRWLPQDGIHSDRGCISSLSVPLRPSPDCQIWC